MINRLIIAIFNSVISVIEANKANYASMDATGVSVATGVVGPKRKPFPNMKQTVNTDAGEWIVKEVDGKRVFVEAYPTEPKVEERKEVPKVQDGAKRKPFLNQKQTTHTNAGQWIVKEVDGKRVFIPV